MEICEYKTTNLLFIKGVFIKDCMPVDDIFEMYIMEKLNAENPIVIYDKLPSKFHNIQTWISHTNIKCWYCDLNFDNTPIFIPNIIEHIDINEYNISTMGCFCSFCCAMAYNNLHNQKLLHNLKTRDMLIYLYYIFYKININDIIPSPSKYIMNQYSGNIDALDYKEMISKIMESMKNPNVNRGDEYA